MTRIIRRIVPADIVEPHRQHAVCLLKRSNLGTVPFACLNLWKRFGKRGVLESIWSAIRASDQRMSRRVGIEGYAIVFADGMIADRDRQIPKGLKIDADVGFFKASRGELIGPQ